ncbi:hypothetical protein DRW03_08265 [Corallococcus sp. H22C18031201]|nr:hypothetical protein DRW03_08265 [Corallococcus sp. H22C18031201]
MVLALMGGGGSAAAQPAQAPSGGLPVESARAPLLDAPVAEVSAWLAARHALAPEAGTGGAASPRHLRPPMLRLFVAGTTTWRRYCARPGVKSCGEYDRKPIEQQTGDTETFSSSVPYLGFDIELEVLPLAHWDSALRGLGVVLAYQRGFSSTNVTLRSETGQTPKREVDATDTAVTAQAMYRYYFNFGSNAQPGYVGTRFGLHSRSFSMDASSETPLLGTHRVFPTLGVDVSVPLFRSIRLEAAGGLFLGAQPGKRLGGDDDGRIHLEVSDHGASVSSFGWNAVLGIAGDIWGPLGYAVHYRLTHFQDTFTGEGTRAGWSQGGVAEETYSSLNWGLLVSY